MGPMKNRITIEVMSWSEYHGDGKFQALNIAYFQWFFAVRLDMTDIYTGWRHSETKAKQEAQAYVDELIRHFKEGGA